MARISNFIKAIRPGRSSNIRVMVLCMFAATIFWFFNALNENYDTTIKYPVEFDYNTEDVIPLQALPDEVQLNVSGLGWNLLRNSLGIKVTPLHIPLENAEINTIPGSVLPGYITDQLDQFSLNYVLTDTLYINIDNRISRTFSLSVDSSSISLDDNFFITNPIRYTPDSVVLSGPESILAAMPDSITIQIPQENIDEDYNEDVPINLTEGRLIQRDPPTVNVVFGVKEFEEMTAEVPLRLINIPEKAYVEQETVPVRFMIRQDKTDGFNPKEEMAVAIDFNEMDNSDSTVTPKATDFPAYLRSVQVDTSHIKVFYNE